MRKITIIGASGHGKVCAEIARLSGYEEIEFLDDNPDLKTCGKYPVVGKTDTTVEGSVFVAIGNGKIRKHFCEKYKDQLVTLIHPSAVIAGDVKIGRGSVIMPDAVINPGTTVGDGCIVNTSASVDHDNTVGRYTHIAVGAHTAGTVKIGENVWLGIGAIVSNNIQICSNCTIGAGAVVIKDIEIQGTYIGVPARMIKDKNGQPAVKWGGVTPYITTLTDWRSPHERPLHYRSRWVWQRSRMAC